MKRYFLIATLSVALAGCGTQSTVPQDSFYRLTSDGPVTPVGKELNGVLVVPRFLSDGLLSERPMVYAAADSPEKLQQYNYHFWIESPARMLQELTVDFLRRSGAASMVVTPEFRAAGAYELIGKIKRLEQIRGAAQRVAVALEFGLYRTKDGQLIFLRTYDQSVPLQGEDVAAAAAAMSGAVNTVLAALARDIAAQ
ncbi:MAG: ABC-type transport auxiliary lipoprotein family protein [Gammaproteobacteria bacterium]|nr:ABC-type transport auxiliary lipoprotein family protein [Gammaproteobacteria bacterium]